MFQWKLKPPSQQTYTSFSIKTVISHSAFYPVWMWTCMVNVIRSFLKNSQCMSTQMHGKTASISLASVWTEQEFFPKNVQLVVTCNLLACAAQVPPLAEIPLQNISCSKNVPTHKISRLYTCVKGQLRLTSESTSPDIFRSSHVEKGFINSLTCLIYVHYLHPCSIWLYT